MDSTNPGSACAQPMPFPRRDSRLSIRVHPRSFAAKQKIGGTPMTQLALVIDLNVCVGCHACVTS